MEKTCPRCGSAVVFYDTAQGRLDAVIAMLERRVKRAVHDEAAADAGDNPIGWGKKWQAMYELRLALAAARRIARG